jgi:hypothetical protein
MQVFSCVKLKYSTKIIYSCFQIVFLLSLCNIVYVLCVQMLICVPTLSKPTCTLLLTPFPLFIQQKQD